MTARIAVISATTMVCLFLVFASCGDESDDSNNNGSADVQEEVAGCTGEDCPCVSSCTGKECGDDGCGGSCGNCFTIEGAVDNALCSAQGTCLDCLPDCTDKACGDDGCGGECGNCFTLEGALDNSLCQDDGTCMQCSPDCAGKDCGPNGCGGSCGECADGQGCAQGKCLSGDPLCPDGTFCVPYTAGGEDLGCLVNDLIPADNQTQCHLAEGGCSGNASCLYTDDAQTKSVCVENCGTCPEDQTCGDVTGDGYLGCMVGGSIPSGAQTQCHEAEGGCKGNATCFFVTEDYSESVCIFNCSPCKPGTCPVGEVCESGFCVPEPCTEGSCGEGEICLSGTCVPDVGPGPGAGPGPDCADKLPPMKCTGGAAYCGELIQFDPMEGYGYIDYAENGETLANQYRSWLRRDVVMLIKYATAMVACKAEDWEFGNGGPLGLIDMSEEDGSIPGTSIGQPGHPQGTHVNGFDIDVAYYQHNTANNAARPICDHYLNGAEQYHCTAPPKFLDPWRSAMFLGALYEHPDLRVVGADGQAGPILDACIDTLCDNGWIPSAACKVNKLTYETVDMGWGWYLFHHHHMHVSFDKPNYRDDGQCLVPGCDSGSLQQFLHDYFSTDRPFRPIPVHRTRGLGL